MDGRRNLREIDPAMRRNYWQMIGMCFGVLPLIGVQLYLSYKHDRVASAIVGVILLVVLVLFLIWIRRSGLGQLLRPRRRSSS